VDRQERGNKEKKEKLKKKEKMNSTIKTKDDFNLELKKTGYFGG